MGTDYNDAHTHAHRPLKVSQTSREAEVGAAKERQRQAKSTSTAAINVSFNAHCAGLSLPPWACLSTGSPAEGDRNSFWSGTHQCQLIANPFTAPPPTAD